MRIRSDWRRRVPEPAPDETAESEPAAPAKAHAKATVIDPGCEIEGHFAIKGPLVVQGEFSGSIDCKDVVTIDAGGSAQAEIRGRQVIVSGAVVGDITATREIVLHATGRVHGNLKAPSLVIERGAYFEGRTQMYRPERAAQSASPPAAPPQRASAIATAETNGA